MQTSLITTPKVVAHSTAVLRIGGGFRGKFGGFDLVKEERLVQPYTPDVLTTLRARRKMIKELAKKDPKHVFEMMKIIDEMTLSEALALAREPSRLIVPNVVHDEVLTKTDVQYYVRTGTIIIYEVPDKPFGEIVAFEQTKFVVPVRFRGLKNCALAVEHPDFELTPDGKLVVPDETMIHLIRNFPIRDGWHNVHTETGIPHDIEVESTNESARFLYRLDSSYLGPLVRADNVIRRGNVLLNDIQPSNRLGVALI